VGGRVIFTASECCSHVRVCVLSVSMCACVVCVVGVGICVYLYVSTHRKVAPCISSSEP